MSARSDRRLSRQELASSGVVWPVTVIFNIRCDLLNSVRNMVSFAQPSNVRSSRIQSNEQVKWLMWMGKKYEGRVLTLDIYCEVRKGVRPTILDKPQLRPQGNRK